MTDAWAKFCNGVAVMIAAAALAGLTYWGQPWGSLAEWAAALGTSGGVAAAIWLATKEARDRRVDARAETARLLTIAVHEGCAVSAMIQVVMDQLSLETDELHDELPERVLRSAVDFLGRFPVYELPAGGVHLVRMMQTLAEAFVELGRHLPPAEERRNLPEGMVDHFRAQQDDFTDQLAKLEALAIEYGAVKID